jgi:hypothetical protein
MLKRFVWIGLFFCLFPFGDSYSQAWQPGEPIAFVGHGAMFGAAGNEITPSIKFMTGATQWYITELSKNLGSDQRSQLDAFRRSLTDGLSLDDQAKLIVDTKIIDWLVNVSPKEVVDRVRPKNNAMKALLRKRMSTLPGADVLAVADEYAIPAELSERLARARRADIARKRTLNPSFLDVTLNEGALYRAECASKGVPIPPDFGPGSEWINRGTIKRADLFIVRNLNADILTYTSRSPKGICMALPRYDDNNRVMLDGVICLGLETSNVCFFDNQTGPNLDDVFSFDHGSAQPFSRWAGGTALFASNGGVCTDCHAGENPYIIHGDVLNKVRNESLIMPPNQYNPIVKAGDGSVPWPQNVEAVDPPGACLGCHGTPDEPLSDAGRLPKLSRNLPRYCSTILRASLGALMPPLPGQLNPTPAMPPGRRAGTLACTPGLPSTDPRHAACSTSTTLDCTPAIDCSVDPRDERCSEPDFPDAYKVSCTPDVKSLLTLCEQP